MRLHNDEPLDLVWIDIGQATTVEKVAQTAIAKFGLSLSEGRHETPAR